MLNLTCLIDEFFLYAQTTSVAIYNEFSLQHELGIYLRNNTKGYQILFERNVSNYTSETNTIKKEIDIVIISIDKSEKYALELKHPLNGQYPEQMYSFVKDIKFLEELIDRGFDKAVAVTLVSDKLFYSGKSNPGIYRYFREESAIYGQVFKPTGPLRGKKFINLRERYDFSWKPIFNDSKYYVIEIHHKKLGSN